MADPRKLEHSDGEGGEKSRRTSKMDLLLLPKALI